MDAKGRRVVAGPQTKNWKPYYIPKSKTWKSKVKSRSGLQLRMPAESRTSRPPRAGIPNFVEDTKPRRDSPSELVIIFHLFSK